MLSDHIKALNKMLLPASKRMNWLTIGVMDFVNRCIVSIDKFASIVHQLRKNTEDIEQRLAAIESANLFKHAPRNALGEIPDCEDYFEYVVKRRAEDIKGLVRKYLDIGQILTKVSVVLINRHQLSLKQRFEFVGAEYSMRW